MVKGKLSTIGRVTVMGIPYTIKRGIGTEVSSAYGIVNFLTRTIQVNDVVCANSEKIQETLLHEVIHCIDDSLKLGFDEKTVARLAAGLYASGVRVHLDKES